MSDWYIAGDYAGIKTRSLYAYYGYEETDDSGGWCFKGSFNGKDFRIPFSKLKAKDMNDCAECLLAGIAIMFDTDE